MMAQEQTCPKCGVELPRLAPSGICPRCLLQVGLASRSPVESDREESPTTHWSGFVPPRPEVIAKFFPQLEILELLGKGGMGAVYKARQPGLDRLVAVKILPPELETDPTFAERFTREARALAKLSHQNIVSVFDFGQTDGQFYFIMEYVDGTNLRQIIESGAIKPEEALVLVPQICEALQFAHSEGVVHRDIKPENILVDRQGRVKVADFGLAKLLNKAAAEAKLTGTHQAMGSLYYMAPEQMQSASAVDHRADIYSLGVVFYEVLTGELPIGRFQPPSKKVQIDVRLDEVVLRALEAAPDRRYQQASDVKTEVESIAAASVTRLPVVQSDATACEASVRARLKFPARGLLVAGIVNLLATLLIVLIVVLVGLGYSVFGIDGLDAAGNLDFADTVFVLVVAVVSLVLGIVLIVGSVRMLDLQNSGIAMLAALAAILPLAAGFPISLPFGIWALLVLSRRDVWSAFAVRNAKSAGIEAQQKTDSTLVVMMLIGLGLGLTLGALSDNMGLYLTLGMVSGIVLGSVIDLSHRQARNRRARNRQARNRT